MALLYTRSNYLEFEIRTKRSEYALNTLSNILVLHAQFGENLSMVTETLVKLADKVKPTSPHSSKAPSTKTMDKEESNAQCEADSEEFPFYYCLKTLHLCLSATLKSARPEELAHVPPKVREYLFEHLHFSNKFCIRKMAAEILGILSAFQLEPVVRLFTSKLMICKSDDQLREYVTYQNASVHLRLGLGNAVQVEATNHYLSTIAITTERISRGVVFHSII